MAFASSSDFLHRSNRLEHHPNPKLTRPIDASGRFRVPLPSIWCRRVKSKLGLKSTWPTHGQL